MSETIKFKLLNEHAKLPSKGSEEAAGFDLCTTKDFHLHAGQQMLIPTGVAMEIPRGLVGLIWPRSKLANKFGISVEAGVIDSDYRGEIHVILRNHGERPLIRLAGSAIAQILIQQVFNFVPVEQVIELDTETERGAEGITSKDMRH